MAQDQNGNELAVGDRVLVPCVVRAVHGGERVFNLTAEPEAPPTAQVAVQTLHLNGCQVTKAEPE